MLKKLFLILLILVTVISISSCSSDDERNNIEGAWIVAQWTENNSLVMPTQVVRWRFSNGKAIVGREQMLYLLEGDILTVGSTKYTIKFKDSYTMEWNGGYGHYKRAILTRDF